MAVVGDTCGVWLEYHAPAAFVYCSYCIRDILSEVLEMVYG